MPRRRTDDADPSPGLTEVTQGPPASFPVSIVPWPLLAARRRVAGRAQGSPRFATVAMVVLLSALFMVNLSVTLISVAIPRIADEFDTSQGALVWAVTGPILASAVLGPAFGKSGDLFGHRLVFLLALTANAVFTVLIAMSVGPLSFVGTRVLAAAAGSAAAPAALAFINRLYDRTDRAGALGWWSFVMAGSPVLGVVAGGVLVDTVGWRWVFVVQAPLVMAAAVVAALILPETTRGARVRFDVAGATTLAVTVGAAMLAVTLGPRRGWTDPVVLALPVVSALTLAAFVRIENRAAAPLIPPSYWRRRNFVFPTLTLALTNVAYMGSFVLVPLMLQSTAFAYSAAQTSRVIIARPLSFALVGPMTGRLAVRVGERGLGVLGAVSIVVSMLVLTQLDPGGSAWLVAGALGLAGVGMGMAAPAMTATVANTVSESDLGVAGAAQQMLQQVSLVLGIQGLEAVQSSIEHRGVAPSYQAAFAVAALVAVFGVATSMLVHSVSRDDPVNPVGTGAGHGSLGPADGAVADDRAGDDGAAGDDGGTGVTGSARERPVTPRR